MFVKSRFGEPESTPHVPGLHPCTHFIGFRGEEYWSAVKVWGLPDFISPGWDMRARRELADGDTVIFTFGPADQEPRVKSYPDLMEREI